MDRQTRIAFGLIFVLLIVYFSYMSRFRATAPPAAPDSLRSETPAEPAPPPVASPREPVPAPEALVGVEIPTRRIVVETPLARYHLDSRGARIVRLELLEFTGVGSEFVELVAARADSAASGVLGVRFQLPSGQLDSSNWKFLVELPEGEDVLRVGPGERRELRFRAADGVGGALVKTFGFDGGGYEIDLNVQAELAGGLAQCSAVGIEWERGLPPSEKNRKGDIGSFRNLHRVGEEITKHSLKDFRGSHDGKGSGLRSEEGSVQWAATESKYFLAALVPASIQEGSVTLSGSHQQEYLGFRADFPLRGGRDRYAENFHVYAGPLLYNELKGYGRGLETLVDMGSLIRPISLATKWLMDFMSRFIPNYGVVIILLSLITKVIFYRLTHKSFKSMRDMQLLQPKVKALQEKYKNSREQLNRAMLELYKEHGVNPLGGCLPLLLQMPVFFALYKVLQGAVELRGAGFIGWIDDLSTMDVLYRLPFNIPLLGGFIDNSISVLPILMGLSMWIQQKLGGTGLGGEMSQPAGQMQAMNKIMPIFMTFIFYRMPSGLVLYWLVNTILSAVQQYYIHKGMESAPTVVAAKA